MFYPLDLQFYSFMKAYSAEDLIFLYFFSAHLHESTVYTFIIELSFKFWTAHKAASSVV